jgi:hypothetical protein
MTGLEPEEEVTEPEDEWYNVQYTAQLS